MHPEKNVLSLPRLMEEAYDEFFIPPTNPEDPALLHFTSGTTALPKVHFMYTAPCFMHYITGKYVLDFHAGDVFWCTADPGWLTGTSTELLLLW